MNEFAILFLFLLIFGIRGIPLFLIYLLIKTYWPEIQNRLRAWKKSSGVVDLDEESGSIWQSSAHRKAASGSKPSPSNSFASLFTLRSSMASFPAKYVALIIAALAVLFIIIDGLVFVPAGHVGVVFDQGRGVLHKERQEGISLKIPFWQKAVKIDVRTQEYTMSGTRGEGAVYSEDSMQAPTADGQTVTIDATILFHVDKEKASNLYQEVGLDYINKIVRATARSQVRMVISQFPAIDIYSAQRAVAEQQMTDDIKVRLAEKGIVLERVLLRNVAFSAQYATAIEEKQIAQQRIQKAEFERQEAEKLKEKKIIEAQAEAESIRLKGETLRSNPLVIQLEMVQKMADDISWGVLPDGVLPLVDLKNLNR